MPEVFHWQTSHNPRTGNRVYGGTVNFKDGLTDAGLQEYLYASQLWHSLCRDPMPQGSAPSRAKHARQESREAGPLIKRLAFRQNLTGCRRVWTAEEAFIVLKQMYGPDAAYKGKQAQALQAVIQNRLQVVAILGTGEGKSLLYQLPARLPGAGTTILIVPLVALKQDTMRRCQQLGIDCAIWSHTQPPSPGCPLLLVSLDRSYTARLRCAANSEGLRSAYQMPSRKDR